MNRPARQWSVEHHKKITVPKHARLYPVCGNDLCVNPDHMASHRFMCRRGHSLKQGAVIWERTDGRWTRRCVECSYSHEPPEGVFVMNLD